MASKPVDSEANFRVNIDGNASKSTKEVTASARLAAQAISKYEAEIKELQSDLRRLKGNSEEVKAAKEALKAKIDAAKASVSSLTLELHKQGVSYDAASKATKRFSENLTAVVAGAKRAAQAVGRGVGAATAPLGKLIAKTTAPARNAIAKAIKPGVDKAGAMVGSLAKKVSSKLEPAAKLGAKAFAPVGRAAAKLGAVGKSALGGIASVAKPLAEKALPAVGMGLRAAAVGAGAAAAAVAAVGLAAAAGAVALTAFSLAAADGGAKLQRQREAILGNAKDARALGDQINDLAGRVSLGTDDLQQLSIALSKTRLSGTAIVNTLNAVGQATSAIDAQAGQKLQEIITRGARSGRMAIGQFELEGTGIEWDEVAKEYAAGTKKSIAAARQELFTGQASLEKGAEAIRRVTEKKFGDINLKNAFSLENAPKKFLEQFKHLIGGINLEPITKGLQYAFGELAPEKPLGRAVKSIVETLGSGFAEVAGKSIPALVEGFKWLMVGAVHLGARFYETKKQIKDAFSADGWVGVGKAIVVGLVKGMLDVADLPRRAAVDLATRIKDAFTGKLKIQSPSKVFEQYGRHTTEGYVQGVERGSQRASGAVAAMVDMPSASPAASSSSSSLSVEVNIYGASTESAAAMTSPEFLANLGRVLRDAVTAKGLAAA